MKQLTKAEEQVMQYVWDLKEGVIKDFVEKFPEPKPAYTTVATVLKVLEEKGFVTKRKIGNVLLYAPQVKKEEYAGMEFSHLLKNYFNGSFSKLATFFVKEKNMNINELEDVLKNIEAELKKENKK